MRLEVGRPICLAHAPLFSVLPWSDSSEGLITVSLCVGRVGVGPCALIISSLRREGGQECSLLNHSPESPSLSSSSLYIYSDIMLKNAVGLCGPDWDERQRKTIEHHRVLYMHTYGCMMEWRRGGILFFRGSGVTLSSPSLKSVVHHHHSFVNTTTTHLFCIFFYQQAMLNSSSNTLRSGR